MKHEVKVEGHGTLRVSALTPERLTHAIRLRAGKRIGPSIDEIEKDLHVRTCSFCNRSCRNYHFTFSDNHSRIIGVIYKDDLHYCRQIGCLGKNLNPNSVEFVSMSRRISKEEALNYIKSRNRSPFYAENHATPEAYGDYQATLSRWSPDRLKQVIAKQNHSRGLSAYKDRWGDQDGAKRWHLVQASKGITPERMITKHGEDGLVRYGKWKSEAACTLVNFTRRHGKEEGLQRYRAWVGKVTRKSGYGIRTRIDGMHLYSLFELRFYQALQATQFNHPMQHDTYYPDSAWRSDFYFPMIDRHLEIAGMVGDEAYDRRLQEKVKRYNPLIVQDHSECDTMAQLIKDLHDQL